MINALRALPRRWFFIFVAFVSVLFLLLLHARTSSLDRPFDLPSYKSPPKTNDGHFSWADRPVHYPLKQLASLPKGQPKQLPNVQYRFSQESAAEETVRLARREKIKAAFQKCWSSYRSRAWMHDELSPISGRGRDTFGGWAATMVDALDTLWIMDMKYEFHEAVESARQIDFSKSTDEVVNIFETTIRYLGGFLAAYDLSGERILLDKAIEVGEMLLVAFDTPNHFPITRWQWKQATDSRLRQETPPWMLVSELGSLTLEFTRLSQLTGDMRWYDAITRITDLFDEQQDRTKLPGLWPVVVNPKDKDLTADGTFTLGGMSDSLYEYFPKEFALLGGLSPVYQKLYNGSIAAITKHILFKPMTPEHADILMAGDVKVDENGVVSLQPRNQHLTCFTGGMLALGGRLFSSEDHVELGRKITTGCIWAYENGPRGVMPEIAHFVPCPTQGKCQWDEDRWEAAVIDRHGPEQASRNAAEIISEKKLPKGFAEIDDRRYILRPEAIESVFIMYRVTGDRSYLEAAWDMFNAIQAITETEYGNAAVLDITGTSMEGDGLDKGLPPKQDRMESFWFAETLKYFYLIYSEPELISLDDYVLNTEAHPLRRPV
ncbi:uncharacterized protein A1O9_09607 [Exophiala aquamarina CBS 119918]|uniref:alpha-1,2-Mannosidase n=1 Tax=Exophiala aquamarina CBS 119918 TaxID=1182545 RepID=A0A072PFW5_9EURO|nr:uncharacterized protein A1O9_09607 [Exophiala aquamarina CBS 119918]KEF54440.1 hypothetical protein A1O9_09607 [Exophiala aquamarina CBS 119918]